MLDEPHRIVPLPKPRKERRLSPAQLKILHNMACGHDPAMHIRGMAAHGAFPQTLSSLERRCLIRGRFSNKPELTMEGIKAHRSLCCKQGRTENDELVHQVERRLEGKEPEVLHVQHSELEKTSADRSIFRVWCPACKLGILLVGRDQEMKLRRRDRCIRCAQTFKYVDRDIGGERFGEEDGEDEG
jgi:hypothetical protein